MNVLTIEPEVFRTVATNPPRPRQERRPRHRDPWSPAERRAEFAPATPCQARRCSGACASWRPTTPLAWIESHQVVAS